MLRILVVEDTPKHLEDAIRVGQELGLEIITRTTSRSARELITEGCDRSSMAWKTGDLRNIPNSLDGVITDIHMPVDEGRSADNPAGVGVVVAAERLGVPVVMCTAGNHHGERIQWITDIWKEILVDCRSDQDDAGGEAESKNWARAFKKLLERIEWKKSRIQK